MCGGALSDNTDVLPGWVLVIACAGEKNSKITGFIKSVLAAVSTPVNE